MEKHSVIIKAVHTSDTIIRIDPKATCHDLKQLVIKRLNIEEPSTFGLAQLEGNVLLINTSNINGYKYYSTNILVLYPLQVL